MNTKKNKRFRETEKRFEAAMLHLLSENKPSQITVNMICAKAELHRSTFYLHYTDIYDLLKQIGKQIQEDRATKFMASRVEAFSKKHFLILAQDIKKNRAMYKLIFHANRNQMITPDAHQLISARLQEKGCSENSVQYMIEFWKEGLNAVLLRWIEEDCKTEDAEIAEVLYKCSSWI